MTPDLATRRIAPFVFLQAASVLEVVGGSMLFILMPWLVLNLTHSSTASGAMIAITSIPGLLLSPVLGSFIDRIGRRKVAMSAAALAAASNLLIPAIDSSLGLNLFWIILLGIIRNAIGSAMPSSRKALLPDVARVGKISLERANSIHEALFSTGFAIGPALAAFTILLIGAVNSFWIVAFFTLLSAVFISFIRVTEEYDDDPSHHGVSWFTYALEGFKALPKYPAVFLIFLAFVSLALVYLPTEMLVLPRYYNQIKDPTGLGILVSMMGAFGAIGALSFEQIAKRFSYVTILRTTLLGVTIAVVGMSFLPPQPVMLLFGALIGAVWGPLPPLLNTVIQRMVPAAMRGRVFSIEITIWSAAPMISMFFAGLMVDSLGVQPSYFIFGALVTIASIIIATARSIPRLREAQQIVAQK